MWFDSLLESPDIFSRMTNCLTMTITSGDVICVELASLINKLDCDVMIIVIMDEIMPGMCAEFAKVLHKTMENKYARIFTSAKVTVLRVVRHRP